MATLSIVAAGPLSTVQDLGRYGLQRYGVNVAGVMDEFSARACWLLLGQRPGQSPLIEVSPGGLCIEVDAAVVVAVTSSGFAIDRDGEPMGSCALLALAPGQRLQVRAGPSGRFAYVGLAAHWALAPVLGSWSTHLRSGLGPCGALAAGDRFELTPLPAPLDADGAKPPLPARDGPLRCIDGPQQWLFDNDQIDAFYRRPWRVAPASDRMATALDGEPLRLRDRADIVSDGIAAGSVQVPGAGLPFVLMADRGSTGGYPKIAALISADLGRLAQARPGQLLRFARCDLAAAAAARREANAALERWRREPAIDWSSERLLALDLIGALDWEQTPS